MMVTVYPACPRCLDPRTNVAQLTSPKKRLLCECPCGAVYVVEVNAVVSSRVVLVSEPTVEKAVQS